MSSTNISSSGEVVLANATRTTKKAQQKPIVVQPPTSTKKRTNPSTRRARVTNINFIGHPEIKVDDIMKIDPEPGYGTPKNLTDLEKNTGRLFVRWLSFEKNSKVGYMLFDEEEAKWWADPASIHILSRAQGYNITHTYFSFAAWKEDNILHYGFAPKSYAEEQQLRNFATFAKELNTKMPEKCVLLKMDKEEKRELKPIPLEPPKKQKKKTDGEEIVDEKSSEKKDEFLLDVKDYINSDDDDFLESTGSIDDVE